MPGLRRDRHDRRQVRIRQPRLLDRQRRRLTLKLVERALLGRGELFRAGRYVQFFTVRPEDTHHVRVAADKLMRQEGTAWLPAGDAGHDRTLGSGHVARLARDRAAIAALLPL